MQPDAATLLPLPAGVYDVRAFRGPDWDTCDYEGTGDNGTGVVKEPDDADLQQWAHFWVTDGPEGTWSPRRSCIVVWDADPSQKWFYKAGDGDLFDISWTWLECSHHARNPYPSTFRYSRVCETFDRFVRAAYRDQGKADQAAAAILCDEASALLHRPVRRPIR